MLVASFVWGACNSNGNKGHMKQDKRAAETVGGWLYFYTMNGNYDSIYNLMSDDYYKKTSKEQLANYIKQKESKLGAVKNFVVKEWSLNEAKDTHPEANYVLKYDVEYDRGKSEETLYLSREDKQVKIVDYEVESEDLN